MLTGGLAAEIVHQRRDGRSQATTVLFFFTETQRHKGKEQHGGN